MKPVNEMSLDELRKEVTIRRQEAGIVSGESATKSTDDPTTFEPVLSIAIIRNLGRFGPRKLMIL
jgi:hypothetical protein